MIDIVKTEKTRKVFFSLIAFCLFSHYSSPATACVMKEEKRLALFHEWDTDRDNKISRAEYVKGQSKLVSGGREVEEEGFKLEGLPGWDDKDKNGTIEFGEFFPYTGERCFDRKQEGEKK